MFNQIEFIKKLYPLHRTLVSDDSDLTLDIIHEHLPNPLKNKYNIIKIPSGSKCWTWTVPKKYIVNKAYIDTEDGKRIADFHDHYLHIASYSRPVDKWMNYDELASHIFYSKKRPDAILWKFYYYIDNWAFCISYNDFKKLDKNMKYKVVIDADFKDDFLKIGELFIPGKQNREMLLITNYCHPCQVNDSVTGISAVIDFLHLFELKQLDISIRVLFLPETIGSICYFATATIDTANIKFGIFTEMLGNDNTLALQLSYQGNTYIDQVANCVFKKHLSQYRTGKFREIVGNDELVTNGPWLNIPTISISRSEKTMDSYPEYHTSDDTPDILIENNLYEASNILHEIFRIINFDYIPVRNFKGPIFLSGYGLWNIWGNLEDGKEYVDKIMYLMEGDLSVFEISQTIGLDFYTVKNIIDKFKEKDLVKNYKLRS